MNLKGLKINFLGDSITEGHGASDVSLRFTSLLAQRYGIIERNYGIGGTRIARQQCLSDIAKYDMDFCLRAEMMQKDADVIFVFGGTNDFGHGDAHFGSSDDSTPDTFCGALNVLFTKLTKTYPNSKIIVATPLHRHNEYDLLSVKNKTEAPSHLKRYVDAIKDAADRFNLTVCDLYSNSILAADKEEVSQKYFVDGLHPNDLGYSVLADEVAGFLLSL